jgi:O-antigen/teichoic acid export membrane protein
VTEQVETPKTAQAVRNTVSMMASRIIVAVLGWAGTVIIARILSPDEWGQFSFVFGILGLMSIITDLGVGRVVLARLIDGEESEQGSVAASFIALRVLLGLVGYAVAVLFVLLSGYPGQVVWATAVAGLVIVVATPSHALTVLYQSRLRLTYVAAAEMFGQLAQLVLTVVTALVAPILIVFVLPAVANEVVVIAAKIRGVRRNHLGLKPVRPVAVWRWKEMLLEAVPLSIGFAFIEMTSRVDLVMLAHLDTFESVGLYSIGYKFADLVLMLALAVVTPFTTLLVAAWPHEPEAFRRAVHRAGAIIAVLCGAGVAAFWPSAEQLLSLLYGERFAAAGSSTRLMVIGACLSALVHLGLMALVSAGRHRVYPWACLGAFVLNVVLNMLLIPRYSYSGAAWATVISAVTLTAAIGLVLRTGLGISGILPLRSTLGCVAVTWAVIAVGSTVPAVAAAPWALVAVGNALVVLALAYALRLTGGVRIPNPLRRGPSEEVSA